MPIPIRQTTSVKNRKFWSTGIKNEADKTVGELFLYGLISEYSWWGDDVTPEKFKSDLDELGDIEELIVHISSDGGDVFAGTTIYSLLKQYPKPVNVYIEGLAASIATVVAMAGDKISISPVGMMMVHNPLVGVDVYGYFNESELAVLQNDIALIMADMAKWKEPIIAAYMSKMSATREELIAWMDGDNGQGTWFTAEECVAAGFADEYIAAEVKLPMVASIAPGRYTVAGRTLDLTRYPNAPALQVGQKIEIPTEGRTSIVAKKKALKNTLYDVTCPNCSAVFTVDTNASTDAPAIEVSESGDEGPENRRVKNEVLTIICPECGQEFEYDSETGTEPAETTPENAFQRGVKAERARMAALDELDQAAAEFPTCKAIVAKARQDGTSAVKAQQAVIAEMAKQQGKVARDKLAALRADGNIPPLGTVVMPRQDDSEKIADGINALRGVK